MIYIVLNIIGILFCGFTAVTTESKGAFWVSILLGLLGVVLLIVNIMAVQAGAL